MALGNIKLGELELREMGRQLLLMSLPTDNE